MFFVVGNNIFLIDVQGLMFRIGVTGGIGSGKSTVCRMLQAKGIPVFYADEEARSILGVDPEVRRAMTDLLGPEAYADGAFNRKWVADQVFNDNKKLAALNAVMYPAVRRRFIEWTKEQRSDIVAMESAILLESGGDRLMDHLVLVTAPVEIRVARAMKRDGANESQIRARIAVQMDEEEQLDQIDTLIVNDADLIKLESQVRTFMLHLHEIAGTQ